MKRIFTILMLFLLVSACAYPVLAAGNGNGGDGGGSGDAGNGGSGGDSGNGGGSDSSGASDGGNGGGDGNAGPDDSGSKETSQGQGEDRAGPAADATQGPAGTPTQSQPRTEEQERAQAETVEQPGVQIHDQDRDQIQGRTNDEFFLRIQEKEMDLLQNQTRDQDRDRINYTLAVYSLSIAGNVTGNSGPELVRLALQVNQSLENATQAEMKIQERSTFTRTFFGGDRDAAGILLQTTEQNQERIRLMTQLIQDCQCNATVQAMLQEQIRNLEQEQNRLLVLAQQEQNDTGLFGWLFR